MLRHSSRNLPLKLSSVPFCHGLPGSISAVSMPAFCQPFEDRFAHEFGAVIRAQVARRTAFADQPRQHLDDALQNGCCRRRRWPGTRG